jgi:nucleoside-diphosphate-sugar epimerase
MKVFLTGATGFIGSAIVRELLGAGHQVLGLARSDQGVAQLTAAGALVHRGSLEDLESLKAGASASDGVIHTAFVHDFSKLAAAGETDLNAIGALGDALAGSGRALVVTSATAHLSSGTLGTENDRPAADARAKHRIASEEATLALAERGVRSSLVRLPPSVHGDGDQAFVPTLIRVARQTGVAAYVGDGSNRWPAVHRLDAARLFRLAMEKGAPGSRFHGIADQGVPMREIAATIGRHLGIPVVGKSVEEAAAHFGWLAHFVAIDCPSSSDQTQRQLHWHPTHPSLLDDLDHGTYFES